MIDLPGLVSRFALVAVVADCCVAFRLAKSVVVPIQMLAVVVTMSSRSLQGCRDAIPQGPNFFGQNQSYKEYFYKVNKSLVILCYSWMV